MFDVEIVKCALFCLVLDSGYMIFYNFTFC